MLEDELQDVRFGAYRLGAKVDRWAGVTVDNAISGVRCRNATFKFNEYHRHQACQQYDMCQDRYHKLSTLRYRLLTIQLSTSKGRQGSFTNVKRRELYQNNRAPSSLPKR